jgi:hypothetical protein
LSDGELMAKVSAGSVESFVDLYERYCDRAQEAGVGSTVVVTCPPEYLGNLTAALHGEES